MLWPLWSANPTALTLRLYPIYQPIGQGVHFWRRSADDLRLPLVRWR